MDEDPQLILGVDMNLVVQVSLCDGLSSLGQFLERDGDALGQIETKPRGREQDYQRDHDERKDVALLDRILKSLELFVFRKGLCDLIHFTGKAFVNDHIDNKRADNTITGCSGFGCFRWDLNGNDGPDQISERCIGFFHRLLTTENLLQCIRR